jgi:AraC-like DNA-binding protein
MYHLPPAVRIRHRLDASNPFIVERYLRSPHPQLLSDMHYDLQVIVVLSGAEEIVFSSYRTELRSGQICWTSCWEPHAIRTTRANTEMLVITFFPEELGSASPFSDVTWMAPFLTPPAERPQARSRAMRQWVRAAAIEILGMEQEHRAAWRTLQWLKIHELIARLTTGWHPAQSARHAPPHHEQLTRILPAIAQARNSPCRLLSLTDSARLCGLSRSQFSALFTRATGASFGQFAIRVRTSEAARLLRTTELPIKAVANQCGFVNVTHFYHIFRRHFHCPPGKCRQLARSAASALYPEAGHHDTSATDRGSSHLDGVR